MTTYSRSIRDGMRSNPTWKFWKKYLNYSILIVSINSQHRQSHRCLCTFKILFKKVTRKTTPDLRKMAVRYLEQKNRQKDFSSRERQLEKPASGAANQGQVEGQGEKKQRRLAYNGWSMLSRRQVWNETRSKEEARMKKVGITSMTRWSH